MKIESFYRHFLLTPVNHLPVVDDEKNLVGLLSKEKISHEMADLSSEGHEYQRIPDHILDREINESVLFYFQNNRTIPVLNLYSQRVDSWEKPRFLAEVSKLMETAKEEPFEEAEEESSSEPNSKLLIYKFMELILRNFPDALYATDKEGNTTFYNEKFETTVLSRNIFRDSITIAEKYFKEVSRDLISEYFKSTEDEEGSDSQIPPLITYIRNLQLFIKLTTLRADEKVIGFLYHFTDPRARSMVQKGVSNFPVIEEAFEMELPLAEVLKDVESSYILKTFQKSHENISHTAAALKIPRSTLQNRIKYLGLTELMIRDPEVPIPRTRKDDGRVDEKVELDFPKETTMERKSKSLLVQRAEDLKNSPKEEIVAPETKPDVKEPKSISKKKSTKEKSQPQTDIISKKKITKKKGVISKPAKVEKTISPKKTISKKGKK
jgi:hypothetical protein